MVHFPILSVVCQLFLMFLHVYLRRCKYISIRFNKHRGSAVQTLRNDKSTGPLSIPNKLFKQFKKPVSESLTLLINVTFSEGRFPSILKEGKIFLVHKKGCKTEVTNYRPTSLLLLVTKIFSFAESTLIYKKYLTQ